MKKNTILYIIIGILALAVLFFVTKSLAGNQHNNDVGPAAGNSKTGAVSGTIEYSGLKPEEEDEGYVYIEYREHNTGEFQRLEDYKIPLQDHVEWKVEEVSTEITYDARAVLVVGNGDVIARSNTITATAPVQHEVFEFNVTYDMLPDYVLEDGKDFATLEGYVLINGYIPSGATLSMFAREKGSDADFDEVVANTRVTGQRTDWSWAEALPGRTYEIKTEAYNSNGGVFASSFVGEKAAPSDNAHFDLTSRAEDPSDAANKLIKGTVKVNGNYNGKSMVHIKARVSGDSEYKTVTTVHPSNSSTSWEWNGAVSGVSYDIKPFIVEQGKDDIRGDAAHTTAPARNINLHVDTQHSPSAPSNEPKLESCNNIEDNKYQAKLKFDNIDDADKYRLQVGKSKGASDVNNSVVNNSGNTDPKLTVNINKDQNYYARYSYTKCEDCDGQGAYSDWSDSLKFKCE